MKRALIGFGLLLCLGASSGCVTSALDKEMLNVRQAANANEKLYAAAELGFASSADQIASQKHMLQRQFLNQADTMWMKDHTGPDGTVTAGAKDFAMMLSQRDAAYSQLGQSETVWHTTVENFRRMVTDKQTFSATIYAKEVDAQAAKDSFAAATDSLVKVLAGAVPVVATLLPFAF
jgi:hypothetical protein